MDSNIVILFPFRLLIYFYYMYKNLILATVNSFMYIYLEYGNSSHLLVFVVQGD